MENIFLKSIIGIRIDLFYYLQSGYLSCWWEPTQVIINGAGRVLGLSNAGSYYIIDTIGAWEGSLIFC